MEKDREQRQRDKGEIETEAEKEARLSHHLEKFSTKEHYSL